MPLNQTRQCSVCKKTLPFNARHFVTNAICVDGLESRCKPCRNLAVKNFKRANSSKLATQRRIEYAADNGAAVKAREMRRELRNPFRIRATNLLHGMRTRAAMLKLPFEDDIFTLVYLEKRLRERPTCECCGNPFEILPRDRRRNGPRHRSPSTDRIIPALGYTLANVAILCWRCNNLKRDATADELEKVAAWMRVRAAPKTDVTTDLIILAALSEAA